MSDTTTETPAHDQTITLHIISHIPHHPTREDDPYYHIFNEARNRMKTLGLLKCWVCGATEQIEVHHTEVEFAFARGVDIARFAELHPDMGITDDATFEAYVEGPHNLTPLCKLHHTGVLGIHKVDYPEWQQMRWWKHELPPPAEVVPSGTVVVKQVETVTTETTITAAAPGQPAP